MTMSFFLFIRRILPRSISVKVKKRFNVGDAGGVYIPKSVGNDVPELHYGVVIDCGSSGSRLYIYVWPEHSGKSDELLQIKQLLDAKGMPVVKKTRTR